MEDEELRKDMKVESQNKGKLQKMLESFEKESSRLIDEENELKKELPEKRQLLETME